MANEANQLATNAFTGSLNDPWPATSWVSSPPFTPPRLDGNGYGIGSLAMGAGVWRGKSTQYLGRSGYKVDLSAKWANPGGAFERSVGLMVRVKDGLNYYVARLKTVVTPLGGSDLRLYKVAAGVETQLGSVYTGVSAATMFTGQAWRVRVEDTEDGNTSVKVYVDPTGPTGDGTLVIDEVDTSPHVRGNHPPGIELGDLVYNTDVGVDYLTSYDFGDEWTEDSPTATGEGWQLEIDGNLYDVAGNGAVETPDAEEESPPVWLETVTQGYGPNGNTAVITVPAWTGGLVKPNSLIRVWYGGTVVFYGRVLRGTGVGSASQEAQTWTAQDAQWLARNVILMEDDGTGVHAFNVTDKDSDEYNPDRQNMTIGDILGWLFDRYTDGDQGLRYFGAAPASGDAYLSGELAGMDAVVPDVAVSNNFATAVQQLVSMMPKWQPWVDPDDSVWHFRDVTVLTEEGVTLTQEWAAVTTAPDPTRSFTRILWRGSKKEEDTSSPVYEFGVKGGDLTPAWNKDQEDKWNGDKRTLSNAAGTILAAGTVAFPAPEGTPKGSVVWIDIPIANGLDPDDFRGAVASVSGDAYTRWVAGHTSTRIYLSGPLWGGGTAPPPGSTYGLSLVDPDAMAYLSAQGVGQAYFLPPVEICPVASPYGGGFKNQGWCGEATVSRVGEDGKVYSQKYAHRMHYPQAQGQRDITGECAVVTLAEKPKPSIGLVNYLPPAGSVPDPACLDSRFAVPQVDVSITLSQYEAEAPYFYEPADGSFEGDAFDEWGLEQTFTYDDPNYTDDSQTDGLRPAARAILDVFSQKVYTVSLTLGTPWVDAPPQLPTAPDQVARWRGLFKSVSIDSAKRATGFESAKWPTYGITWNVRARTTTVQCGSAPGWLGIDAATLTRDLRAAAVNKQIGRAIKDLEDFRNRYLDKAGLVQTEQRGMVPGCEVEVEDYQNKRVINVQEKLEDDQGGMGVLSATVKALQDLVMGPSANVPGDVHSGTGVEDGYVLPGSGAVLGPPGSHDLVGQGIPDGVPNANTGRYGGLTPGADTPEYGRPSDLTRRMGGLAIRPRVDAGGSPIGIEAAPLLAGGVVPDTGYTPVTHPTDLHTLGVGVLGLSTPDSSIGVLQGRDEALMARVGAVEDGLTNHLLDPGTVTPEYPDGVPADLADFLRTPGAERWFHLVQDSWGDKGGPVWEGPMEEGGASADMMWRPDPGSRVLIEVERVASGAGTNGGNFAPVTYGGGAANRYLTDGRVVHKQLHGGDMEHDASMPEAPSLPCIGEGDDAGNPFKTTGDSWSFAPLANGRSGIGAEVALDFPGEVVGKPWFTAVLRDDPRNPIPNGVSVPFAFAWSYQASAWSPPVEGSEGEGIVGDGSGNAVGRFMGPGDAVPPGLRKVSGVIRPGPGAPSIPSAPVLGGIGVDVAVVDGGYVVAMREGIATGEDATNNHPWAHEPMGVKDEATVEPDKVVDEAVGLYDAVSVELNP